MGNNSTKQQYDRYLPVHPVWTLQSPVMLFLWSHCVGHCGNEMLVLQTRSPIRRMVNRLGGWEAMASLTKASHWEQEPINTSGGSWWAAPGSQEPGWPGEMFSILCRQFCPCPVMTEHADQLLRGMGLGEQPDHPVPRGGGGSYTLWLVTAGSAAC